MSGPWLTHTAGTPDHLAAAGYRYLLDLRPDDQPVWLETASGPLLAIPYALELNDSTTMIVRQVSPRDFADMIVEKLNELRETIGDQPIVMGVVLHSFISGVPFRLRAVRRALEHMAGFADEVWATTPAGIDRAYREFGPPHGGAPARSGGSPGERSCPVGRHPAERVAVRLQRRADDGPVRSGACHRDRLRAHPAAHEDRY